MKKWGHELIFVSRINRDGSGTSTCNKKTIEWYQDEIFEIKTLSLSEKTYIASGFNSFVVRLKNN